MYPYYVIKFNNPPGRYYKGPLIVTDDKMQEFGILHQTRLYENHVHRRQAKRYATKEIAQAIINNFPNSFVNCSVEEIANL